MMKKMNKELNGDGLFKNRLRSLFYQKYQINIRSIHRINSYVYQVNADHQIFLVKGFPSERSFLKQKILTNYLKSHDFHETFSFLFDQQILFSSFGRHFSVIEFLPPHRQPFTYNSLKEIQEALHVLSKFHAKAQDLKDHSIFPNFDLIDKYKKRLTEFCLNKFHFQSLMLPSIFQELIGWANFSLNGMEQAQDSFHTNTIIHGDVAHHNFLRHQNGKLYLIDFDLCAKSKKETDYLQLAIRVLPYINWDLDLLFTLSPLQQYERDPWFLYGLLYPSEVLREWNHFFRKKGWRMEEKWKFYLFQKTYHDVLERKKLFSEIKRRLS